MVTSLPPGRLTTRLVDGLLCAYTPTAVGELSPAAAYRPAAGDEVVGHAVAADLRHAYYTTLDAVVGVTADGAEVWRSRFEPAAAQVHGHRPGCALSSDGRVVWVYRPDEMAGRGRPDQWVAVDAATGAALAQADLDTVGHGAVQRAHPVSGEILLNVGEGQDGTIVHRASLAGGRIDLVRYPWVDRCLIDLSPDGHRFLTVDHEQNDLAVHAFPSGEVEFTLTVDDFGQDPDAVFLEWSGGYLTADTLVVALIGETEDEEDWFRHYRVDARSGRVHGEFDAHAAAPDDIRPLGDGSWLTTAASGHPIRWTDR
ncbi:hypothetical protein ABZW03_35285 [Kitasatospora sp. NPDC004799]|uniref:hypothetical protein n=1 Tax=Kitasatospora sp. NPDC004799 TaxID=3154460 RepID=UPI0033A31A39